MSSKLHILQHSLGVDEYGQGRRYRNQFVTGPGSKDFDACKSLVKEGLMFDHGPQGELTGGSHCFTVSPEGVKFMEKNSPKPPRVSRSKQRYREWLEVADCFPDFSFGDWLKYQTHQVRKKRGEVD